MATYAFCTLLMNCAGGLTRAHVAPFQWPTSSVLVSHGLPHSVPASWPTAAVAAGRPSVPVACAGSDLAMFTAEQRYVLTLLQQLPPAQRTVAALYYDGLTSLRLQHPAWDLAPVMTAHSGDELAELPGT